MELAQTVARADALAHLSPRLKEAATLYAVQQLSRGEVAQVMGISEHSVKSMLGRVYKRLELDSYHTQPGRDLAFVYGFIEGYKFARSDVDLREATAA